MVQLQPPPVSLNHHQIRTGAPHPTYEKSYPASTLLMSYTTIVMEGIRSEVEDCHICQDGRNGRQGSRRMVVKYEEYLQHLSSLGHIQAILAHGSGLIPTGWPLQSIIIVKGIYKIPIFQVLQYFSRFGEVKDLIYMAQTDGAAVACHLYFRNKDAVSDIFNFHQGHVICETGVVVVSVDGHTVLQPPPPIVSPPARQNVRAPDPLKLQPNQPPSIHRQQQLQNVPQKHEGNSDCPSTSQHPRPKAPPNTSQHKENLVPSNPETSCSNPCKDCDRIYNSKDKKAWIRHLASIQHNDAQLQHYSHTFGVSLYKNWGEENVVVISKESKDLNLVDLLTYLSSFGKVQNFLNGHGNPLVAHVRYISRYPVERVLRAGGPRRRIKCGFITVQRPNSLRLNDPNRSRTVRETGSKAACQTSLINRGRRRETEVASETFRKVPKLTKKPVSPPVSKADRAPSPPAFVKNQRLPTSTEVLGLNKDDYSLGEELKLLLEEVQWDDSKRAEFGFGIKEMEGAVRTVFPKADLLCFGPPMIGTALKSDKMLSLCLLTHIKTQSEELSGIKDEGTEQQQLLQIVKVLESMNGYIDIRLESRTSPVYANQGFLVLTFYNKRLEMNCQLRLDKEISVFHSQLIRVYCGNQEIRNLFSLVSLWAENQKPLEIKNEDFHTHTISFLLVLFLSHLGTVPPIIDLLSLRQTSRPVGNVEYGFLDSVPKPVDNSADGDPDMAAFGLLDTMKSFFEFYSRANLSESILCTFLGAALSKLSFQKENEKDLPIHLLDHLKVGADGKARERRLSYLFPLVVQDPFDPTVNLTISVTDSRQVDRFKKVCAESAVKLSHILDIDEPLKSGDLRNMFLSQLGDNIMPENEEITSSESDGSANTPEYEDGKLKDKMDWINEWVQLSFEERIPKNAGDGDKEYSQAFYDNFPYHIFSEKLN